MSTLPGRSVARTLVLVVTGLLSSCCCARTPRCPDAGSVNKIALNCNPTPATTTLQRLTVTNHHAQPIAVTPKGGFTDPGGTYHPVTFTPSSITLYPVGTPNQPSSRNFLASSSNVDVITLELRATSDPASNSYTIPVGAATQVVTVTLTMYYPCPCDDYEYAYTEN